MPRRLLVFDLDDTLYLERDFVRSGYRAVSDYVREHLGVRGFYTAAWRHFLSGRRGRVFDDVLAGKGVRGTRGLIRKLVSIYRTHPRRLTLCPDARRLLRRPPVDTALAIITDGPVSSQACKVRSLGLQSLVHDVIMTGRWGPEFSKPHPRAFHILQRRFRVASSDCTYVADNPAKDFQAPRALGWQAVRIRRPGGLHFEVPAEGVVEIGCCDELRSQL